MREQASDFTLHLAGDQKPVFHGDSRDEGWEVTFAKTGLQTGIGGRIRRAMRYVDFNVFALTYGDGIGEFNLTAELKHHVEVAVRTMTVSIRPAASERSTSTERKSSGRVQRKANPRDRSVSGGFFLFQREPPTATSTTSRSSAGGFTAATSGRMDIDDLPHEDFGPAWTCSKTGPNSTAAGTAEKRLGRFGRTDVEVGDVESMGSTVINR